MFSGMENQVDKGRMLAAHHVPGFRARARIGSDENEPPAFVVTLSRLSRSRQRMHGLLMATMSERRRDAAAPNVGQAAPVCLDRRQEKRCVAHAVRAVGASMTRADVGRAI